MSKMSPKDIDKLFQEGADKYDFEYNAEAWAQMEKLLDEDEPRRRLFWWWFFGTLMAISLIAYGTYAYINNNTTSPTDHKTSNIGKTESISSNVTKKEDESAMPAADAIKDLSTPSGQASAYEKIEGSSDQKISEPSYSLSSRNKNNPTTIATGEANNIKTPTNRSNVTIENGKSSISDGASTPASRSQDAVTSSISSNRHLDTDKKSSDRDATDNDINSTSEADKAAPPMSDKTDKLNSQSTNNTPYEDEQKRDAILIDLLDIVNISPVSMKEGRPESIAERLTFEQAPALKEDDSYQNKFQLGLLLAHEWTKEINYTESFNNWRLGAYMSYKFRNNYGLDLGVNYLKKDYAAGEGAYTAPPGFWVRSIQPETTNAICYMLEIPISGSYYLNGYDRNGLYAEAGLISTIMLRETYNYTYTNPEPDLKMSWTSKKASIDWLSTADFAIGYKHTADRIDIHISPYIQIPLSGIGHGQIKLRTIGIRTRTSILSFD